MAFGKINWSNLLNYIVQPTNMDLFQTYMLDYTKKFMNGVRSKGVVWGGKITVVSGLQIKVSAGVAIMPDGQIVEWDDTNITLSSGNVSNPRLDRIELSYTQTANSSVVDVNNLPKVLDYLFVPSLAAVQGTPAASPSLPTQTANTISLGYVSVATGSLLILSGDIYQIPGSGLEPSVMLLGDKKQSIRLNEYTGVMQFSNDGGSVWQPMGSGGGGAGSLNWQGVSGAAPVESFEYDERVLMFEKGSLQQVVAWIKVPSGFIAGKQIQMKLGHYSPSTSNTWKFQVTTTLIRAGVDAITSTTNTNTTSNSDETNTVANQLKNVTYSLTDSNGAVNSISVAPGDLLAVKVQRVAPSGTEDTNDVRLIPSMTEVLFS